MSVVGFKRLCVPAVFGLSVMLSALPTKAGFNEVSVAPGSGDFQKIANITGSQVKPGYVARVGNNGAMGFKLPDGSAFVIGDLHSTRTDVGGVELTKFTPAGNGRGAVVEITMTEGNLAVDTSQSGNTTVIVRTLDSVIEIPPGGQIACVTALPSGARKGQRTMAAVRNGEVLFRNNGVGNARRVTSRRSIASNGSDGNPRNITHPYNDCCGALEPLRQQAASAPPGVFGSTGPVAVYTPGAAPVVSAPTIGSVAQAPVAIGSAIPTNAVVGAGAAAIAIGAAIAIIGNDDGDPATSTTTTTTTTTN